MLEATSEKAGSLTTLGVLLIDAKRRRVSACSFGQFRPRYLSRTNEWKELACPVHPPLGVFTAPTFAVSTVPLAIGRKWILLTDGFVEARDTAGAQFGAAALAEALSRSADEESDPLPVLEESWRQFSKNGPDRDDATALLVTDSSPLPQSTVECDISPDKIPDLRFFCEQWVASAGLDEVEAYQVVLACDEIFTNVYKHAYQSGSGPVRCEAQIDLTSLTFLVTHWGVGLSSETNIPQAPEEAAPRRLRSPLHPPGFRSRLNSRATTDTQRCVSASASFRRQIPRIADLSSGFLIDAGCSCGTLRLRRTIPLLFRKKSLKQLLRCINCLKELSSPQ